MRIFILLFDFLFFLLAVAFVLIAKYMGFDFLFFLHNCKVMIPVFFIITGVLFIFSFYDLKSLYKKQKDYITLPIAFIITFLFSVTGIYFGVDIFHIVTPKTNLIYIFIIYFIYIYVSRKLYSILNLTKTRIISFGTSRTLTRIKEELLLLSNYSIVYDFKHPTEMSENINIKDIDFVLLENKFLNQDKQAWNIIAEKFINKGILLKTDLNFFEELFLRLPKEGLKDNMWLLTGISSRERCIVYPTIKRFISIIFCLVFLPIYLPIGVIIYFLIKIIDAQSPLFLQERVGFGGKIIHIYKFHTMINGTEKPTKLGSILRRFRLDEIPQIINIIKGDISIVGPRPVWVEEYKYLNSYIPNHSLRVIVKPGLTGWSQLNFKAPPVYCVLEKPYFNDDKQKEAYFKDAIIRLAYDLWYIKNFSFSLDMEILFKTAKRMFIKDKHVS